MPDAPSKTRVSSKIAYQNPWITIHEDQTRRQLRDVWLYGVTELVYGRCC